MSTRKKIIIIVASCVLAACLIAGAFFVAHPKSKAAKERSISKAELAANNGKGGKPCFVAISGTVYSIDAPLYWKDGKHVPSEGQAYCGADLTAVISKSPHGTSVLTSQEKIGKLQD